MEAIRREKISPSDGDREQCRAEHSPPGHENTFYQGSAACKQPPIPSIHAQGCNPNPVLTYHRVRINSTLCPTLILFSLPQAVLPKPTASLHPYFLQQMLSRVDTGLTLSCANGGAAGVLCRTAEPSSSQGGEF